MQTKQMGLMEGKEAQKGSDIIMVMFIVQQKPTWHCKAISPN